MGIGRQRETEMAIYDWDSSGRSSIIYDFFMKKNWTGLKEFYEEHNEDVFLHLNPMHDTALHLAVYSKNIELMKCLLNIWHAGERDETPLGLVSSENGVGNTPLHEAASIGDVELVKLILEKDHKLLKTKNKNGETPFFMAALYGKTKLWKHFAKFEDKYICDHFLSKTSTMLHEAIRGYYFETALEILRHPNIPKNWEDSHGITCFQLLADIPSAFKSGYSFHILETLVYHGIPISEDKDESENSETDKAAYANPSRKTGLLSIRSLRDMKQQHSMVVKITKFLVNQDRSWQQGHNTAGGARPTYSADYADRDIHFTDFPGRKRNNNSYNTPLIAAAKNGITEIVEAILDVFPQAIDHHNHNKENVFHVAVQHRRKNVLDLLYSKYRGFKDCPKLIQKFDADGEGILHKAAYKSDISSTYRPGEALCLQSDIQWFERVRKWVPAHHVNQRNHKELTPQSLFTKEHDDMVKKGQEWLIRTTNSCIIVAVLIATVAFTSIYTVPGGSDKKGKPRLLNTTAFTVFTVSDVASLCSAFTSVVVFLSIITSKMNEQDFRMFLPLKLVLGLSMLFFSVSALMIGFAATLVMTIRNRLHEAAAPIIAIACFPVAFFLLLQLPLYYNITWYTMKDLVRSLIHIIPLGKCRPRSFMDKVHSRSRLFCA